MSLFDCLANLLPQTIFDSDEEEAKCCGGRLGQTGGDPESMPATSEQPQAILFLEMVIIILSSVSLQATALFAHRLSFEKMQVLQKETEPHMC